jgi:hypothetical protein
MNTPNFDIELPTLSKGKMWGDILGSLDTMIEGILLYLCYGIALLCGFKFIIYILNGFASKSYMGTSIVDDTSFSR